MPWFQVDDKVYAHPKFLGLTLAATGLWMRGGAWCAQNLTDGWLPESALPLLTAGQSVAGIVAELESAALWIRGVNGWQYHDWCDWNRTREWHEHQRASNRERQRRYAEKTNAARWGAGDSGSDPTISPHRSNALPNALPDALLTSPNPTQPNPQVVQVSGQVEVVSGTGGSAIRDRDFDARQTASPAFATFWSVATRKTGKGAARKAFAKALAKCDAQTIVAQWMKANAAWQTWPDKSLIPHPSTWLNQERWDDDPPRPHATAPGKTLTALAEADQMEARHDPSRQLATADPGSGIRPRRPAIAP